MFVTLLSVIAVHLSSSWLHLAAQIFQVPKSQEIYQCLITQIPLRTEHNSVVFKTHTERINVGFLFCHFEHRLIPNTYTYMSMGNISGNFIRTWPLINYSSKCTCTQGVQTGGSFRHHTFEVNTEIDMIVEPRVEQTADKMCTLTAVWKIHHLWRYFFTNFALGYYSSHQSDQ